MSTKSLIDKKFNRHLEFCRHRHCRNHRLSLPGIVDTRKSNLKFGEKIYNLHFWRAGPEEPPVKEFAIYSPTSWVFQCSICVNQFLLINFCCSIFCCFNWIASLIPLKLCMLNIWTSVWVLRTPNAGWNMLFHVFDNYGDPCHTALCFKGNKGEGFSQMMGNLKPLKRSTSLVGASNTDQDTFSKIVALIV